MTRSESNEIVKLKNFNFSIDFDFNFDELLSNQELVELLNFVRPNWQNLNSIKYHKFTEGSTNRLIGFSYGNKLNTDSFLMRIYGHNTELFIDRESEIRNICKLNEFNLSAPIFCTFKNGICYGYQSGKPLCREELRVNGSLTIRIAREMAKLHSVTFSSNEQSNSIPDSCLPKLFNKLFTILKKHAPNFTKLLNELGISNIDSLREEVDEILKVLYTINSPIVFCHNDLLMKNIIYDQLTDQLYFIDFEYSAFNFLSFDIANHFCEYSGQDPFDLNLYPSKEHQLNWIAEYLKIYDQLNNRKQAIDEERIEQLYVQICKCSLASHLLWGSWALLQSQYSTIDFDFVKYAKARLNAYLVYKDKFLNM